jgi:hypothetical protein
MSHRGVLPLLALALLMLAAPGSARGAPRGSSGYALEGGVAGIVMGSGSDAAGFAVAAGVWRQVASGAVWTTDLELTRIPAGDARDPGLFPAVSGTERYDASTIVTVGTGADLHFPIATGMSPCLGLRIGAGWAGWGDRHFAGTYEESTSERRAGPIVSLGWDLGMKARISRPRPEPRVVLRLRWLSSGEVLAGLHAGIGLRRRPGAAG